MGASAKRTWLILLTAGLTAVGLLLAALFVERQNIVAHRAQQQNQVRESLSLLRSQLEGNLRSNVLLVRGLVSVIAANPTIDQTHFERAARPLFGGQSQLRNIGAAPDMVIRLMYPLEGNERAIGLDFRKTPAQFESAERARLTRELVLAGPIELAQGGSGLIGRIPVFLDDAKGDDRFWGLISAVIDVNRLYRDSGLLDSDLPIEVAVRGKDAKGELGEVFFGAAELFAADTLRMPVALPYGSWQMAAQPKGGWTVFPHNVGYIRLIFVLAALLILGPMLLLALFDTRQRRAETLLAQSEGQLSLAIDAARLLIWDWDLPSGRLLGTQPLANALGFPANAIEPHFDALKSSMHPEDVPRVEAAVEAHLHELSPLLEIDFRLRGADAAWRWFHLVGRVIERAHDGQAARVSGVLQDITTLKMALLDLEAARAAAEAGSRAKSDFLATMSHEIRTPMNGVLGMADLLLSTSLDAEQKGFVATLQSSGRALLAIINDILDFSKIEAGRLTLESIDFDLAALIGEVCDLLRPRAIKKGLLLELDCPENLPSYLRGDALRIRQVLVNLVGNAIKFTSDGRIDIEISWRPAEDGQVLVRLAVRDTGIGIAPEAQLRLFADFAQVDASTTRRFGGTGLGLIISKRLVEAMQGRIGVVSAPEEGACFWFELTLPVGTASQAMTLRHDEHEIGTAGSDGRRFQGRVLLVEDNPVNMQVARQMLSRLGVEVVTAENGRIGVEHFAAGNFDLVLMDMQMPVMDGIEATQRMRAMQSMTDGIPVPIVALTANVQLEDRERCLAAGMNAFVAKPFRYRDIVAVLQRWLGGRVETPPTVAIPGAAPKVGAGETAVPGEMPVLDTSVLDELALATGMSVAALVNMLFSDIVRMAEELKTVCAQRNGAEMRRLAHSIKSAGAQLGAPHISALARTMEFAARDDQLDNCIDRLPDLHRLIAELTVAVGLTPGAGL